MQSVSVSQCMDPMNLRITDIQAYFVTLKCSHNLMWLILKCLVNYEAAESSTIQLKNSVSLIYWCLRRKSSTHSSLVRVLQYRSITTVQTLWD